MTDRQPGEADRQAGKHPDREAGTVGKAGRQAQQAANKAGQRHCERQTKTRATDRKTEIDRDATEATEEETGRGREMEYGQHNDRQTQTRQRETSDRTEQTETETDRQTDRQTGTGTKAWQDMTGQDVTEGAAASQQPTIQPGRSPDRQ